MISNELYSMGYDNQSDCLEVEFKNGEIFQYLEVSESIYNDLMNSKSKTQFFYEKINNNFIKISIYN